MLNSCSHQLERNPKKGEEKEEVEKKLNGENGENVEDGQPPRNEGLAPPRPRQTYLYVESEGREILVDGKDVEDEEEDGIHLVRHSIQPKPSFSPYRERHPPLPCPVEKCTVLSGEGAFFLCLGRFAV